MLRSVKKLLSQAPLARGSCALPSVLFSKLTWTSIVTQGPVSIVGKLYQFQIVQSLSYALFLTTLNLFCPLASTASPDTFFTHPTSGGSL